MSLTLQILKINTTFQVVWMILKCVFLLVSHFQRSVWSVPSIPIAVLDWVYRHLHYCDFFWEPSNGNGNFWEINNIFLFERKSLSNFLLSRVSWLYLWFTHTPYKVLVFFAHWHEVRLDLGTTTFSIPTTSLQKEWRVKNMILTWANASTLHCW